LWFTLLELQENLSGGVLIPLAADRRLTVRHVLPLIESGQPVIYDAEGRPIAQVEIAVGARSTTAS
jgi:hypothetical protein